MRVGDAVDDEWAVVWLLWQLSTHWDCVISVRDSDGQFLLIEAAEVLPRWVTPSNAENRVWIYKNELHLIPLSHTSPPSSRPHPSRSLNTASDEDDDGSPSFSDSSTYLSLPTALQLVRSPSPSTRTTAPAAVQSALLARLARYPAALKTHMHHPLLQLPLPLAQALHARPELVQRAAEAFYTRDALQLRAAHKMARFPPSPAVLARVGMTRVAYAQLRGQRWTPPRVFGPAPRGSSEKERKRWETGAMIAAGAEMLYQETKHRSSTTLLPSSAEARVEALQRDPGWAGYLERLARAGWFGEEIRGSAKWKDKEMQAAEAYVNAKSSENATRPSFASLVEEALSRPGPAVSEQELRAGLGQGQEEEEEEDEQWLDVGPEELETLLARTGPGGVGASGAPRVEAGAAATRSAASARAEGEDPRIQELPDDVAAPVPTPADASGAADVDVDMDMGADVDEERLARWEAERLREMARRVEEFVQGEGDIEGARFADDILDDDDDMADPDADSDDESERAMELTEEDKKAAMDRLVRPLEAGEYGRMPEDWRTPKPMSDEVLAQAEARQAAASAAAAGASGPGSAGDLEPLDMTQGHRAPLFAREKYEGHSSDSELDEAGQGLSDEEEEEGEDAPLVVGGLDEALADGPGAGVGAGHGRVLGAMGMGEMGGMEVDPDMGEEEAEFLEFARRELGITDQGWGEIVRQREGEGRFVPRLPGSAGKAKGKQEEKEKATFGPEPPTVSGKGKGKAPARATKTTTTADRAAEKAVHWMDATPTPAPPAAQRTPRERKQGGPRPGGNPNLDSFERVMEAMEEELARAKAEKARSGKGKARADVKGKGKGKGKALAPAEEADDDDDDNEDEDEMLRAMDAELRSALKRGERADGDAGDDGDGEDEDGDEEDAPMDYNLIKNFLESFKSQAGLAGPVSGMVGRLDKGWVWPRDEAEE
ncbi:SGT1-domain-containing protein [Calocera cornea HHB12733]|uniref:SGT1-domain-containing protein n=1 Tax=Calocera cornea HHB12733 TaxID=1353952 RepID=A0A165J289_9BASI|nr:SGT1-domain-containing protein [Calocera cornea HHB12733]